jgi:hypothetical protein
MFWTGSESKYNRVGLVSALRNAARFDSEKDANDAWNELGETLPQQSCNRVRATQITDPAMRIAV